MRIILASSSQYRKQLLQRIISNFETDSPDIDEQEKDNESLEHLSLRLAQEKANALKSKYPNALIIGSDQVASVEGKILRKPKTIEKNIKQIAQCSGKETLFHTSVCLLNTATGEQYSDIEITRVKFKTLSNEQVHSYVNREMALDCAGGFKMEGLGIALFEYIKGEDPNALIGLPLIKLITMLEKQNIQVI